MFVTAVIVAAAALRLADERSRDLSPESPASLP